MSSIGSSAGFRGPLVVDRGEKDVGPPEYNAIMSIILLHVRRARIPTIGGEQQNAI